jgi:hypothetical protein
MYTMPIINRTRGKDPTKIGRTRAELISFLAKALLVAVLLVAYFFVVTSFFQGWQKAKFFDDAPDLVFATVSITLLFHVLRTKRSPGDKNLIIGLSLVSLDKLIEVVLQEAQALAPLGSLELVLREPSIIIFGLGFLFILQYLGERVR